MSKNDHKRPRGRPPTIDRTSVLEAATQTFWRLGYDGASLGDLTDETGVSRPTLYTAFGDKEDLFNAVLDHYGTTIASAPLSAFDKETDICKATTAFLSVSAENNTQPGSPSGCLIACCAATAAERSTVLRNRLQREGKGLHQQLTNRFKREVEHGNLSPKPAPEIRASLLVDFMHAQAVQARLGSKREELLTDLPNRVRAVLSD